MYNDDENKLIKLKKFIYFSVIRAEKTNVYFNRTVKLIYALLKKMAVT